jgi:hypothetical protein
VNLATASFRGAENDDDGKLQEMRHVSQPETSANHSWQISPLLRR